MMRPASTGPNWQMILNSLGQGLMAAGSPQGWSAFGPAMANAQQNYQASAIDRRRLEMSEQEAERAQERWEAEQRTANQEATQRDQMVKTYQAMLGRGLMSPPETAGSGLMDGGRASGASIQVGPMSPGSDPRAASRSLSSIPSGLETQETPPASPQPPQQPPQQPDGRNPLDLSPRAVAILSALPPEQGLAILANMEFAKQQGRRTTEIAGRLIDADTGDVIADFSSEEAALRQASRPQTILNMPGNPTPDDLGKGEFAKANATAQAKYFDSVATAGAQAQGRMGDIDQLTKLIELTPQGAGQDYLNRGAALLSRFGVDLGEYTNVPAAQAFQSIVSRIAPTLRVSGSGATSDFEMQQFLASLPAIGNMQGGNRIIASNLKKITERSVQEAYIAAQVQGGDLTPAQGRKKILDLGPLNLDMPKFNGAPASGPGGAPGAASGGMPGLPGGGNLPDPLNIRGQ